MFEYDVNKSKSNKEKHGIDFEEAKELWLDEKGAEIDARSTVEERKMLVAELGGKIWTAVFTRVEENVRIISVRRARDYEREIYNS